MSLTMFMFNLFLYINILFLTEDFSKKYKNYATVDNTINYRCYYQRKNSQRKENLFRNLIVKMRAIKNKNSFILSKGNDNENDKLYRKKQN